MTWLLRVWTASQKAQREGNTLTVVCCFGVILVLLVLTFMKQFVLMLVFMKKKFIVVFFFRGYEDVRVDVPFTKKNLC